MAVRLENPVPKDVTDRKTIKKTDIIVIGNANEKRLSVGAERVITPIETLISRRTTANGNMITAPILNIEPAEFIPAIPIDSVLGILPMGKNV